MSDRKPFLMSDSKIDRLKEMLSLQPEVFSLGEEPFLGSLLTCLGLQFEMKSQSMNRLGPYFGISSEVPWESEIISEKGNIGIRLWVEGVNQLLPQNKDFFQILDASSINSSGDISELVIFPFNIYEIFKKKNMDLVIVRDWVLDTFLCPEEQRVNYLLVNSHEIETRSSMIHTQLLAERRFPLSGTHDIVDHLIDFDNDGFNENLPVIQYANKVFKSLSTENLNPMQLITSYLVGVIVDDLAQPKWYRSEKHLNLATILLKELKNLKSPADMPLELTHSANLLITELRDPKKTFLEMQNTFCTQPGSTLCRTTWLFSTT